jgi:uncharacterized SAM-binding protein YcdF (DUF218 family)
MSRRRRILRRTLFAVLALFLLALLLAYAFPHQILCVDSGPVEADVIVVLGGGWCERPARAAELFKEKVAPKIILSGDGDCEANHDLLVAAGVPDSVILLEPNSRNTHENAALTLPKLRALGAKRVVLVTTWYHSRRALNVFRKAAPDLEFYSRPSYFAYPRSEWSKAGISRRIRAEYAKMPWYWLRYGVFPL